MQGGSEEQKTINPAPPGQIWSGEPKVKSAAPPSPPSVPDRPNYPFSVRAVEPRAHYNIPSSSWQPRLPHFFFFSRGGLWVTWSNSITMTDACPLWPSSLPAAPCQCYCAHLSRPASRGGVARPRRPLPVCYCNILIRPLSRYLRRIFFALAPLGLDAGRAQTDDLMLFLLQEYPTSLKWPEGGGVGGGFSYRQQYYNCTLSAL